MKYFTDICQKCIICSIIIKSCACTYNYFWTHAEKVINSINAVIRG